MIENPIGTLRSPAMRGGEFGRASDQGAIDQRLAAEKREIDPLAGLRFGEQALNRSFRDLPWHVARRPAEAAAFGVAIGAAEIAALGHRERQRAHGRIDRAARRR